MGQNSFARCSASAKKLLISLCFGFGIIFSTGLISTAAKADHSSAQYCSRLGSNSFSCEQDSRCFFSYEINRCVASDLDCSIYRSNQNTCRNTAGCEWNYNWNTCSEDPRVGNGGGGGHHAQCSDYNRDPRACSFAQGCEWDNRFNQCIDSDQGHGQQCSRFDNNPNQCDRTFGCRYDDWARRCESDDQGGGGGHGNRIVINCSAHNSQMQTCHVGGTVISARLLRQTGGRQYCSEGQTWGRSSNGVWVTNGCSADFELIIRRNY